MRRRVIIALVLALFAIPLLSQSVLADTPAPMAAQTIGMAGRAAMVQTAAGQQLRLQAQSQDGSGWLLETALNPVSVQSNGRNGDQIVNVSGTFTLGKAQNPQVTGTVSGWVDANGSGDIKLNGQNNATALDMNFSLVFNGSITATVQGQWPAPPVVAAATQPAPPAQPANHFFWYLSRVSALAAYILLFVTIFIGVGLKARYLDRILERWRAYDLHQFTALLAVGLIFLHIFSLLGDSYFNYTVTQLLVPGASPYRAGWITWGIFGFYALLVVTISGYFRSRMKDGLWKGLHIASFVMFGAIFIHSIMAGTDTSEAWTRWLYISTGTTLACLILWRMVGLRAGPLNEAPAVSK